MSSPALITLGGSMSRFADLQFGAVQRPTGIVTVSIIPTQSGLFSLMKKARELRRHSTLLAVGFAGALAHNMAIGDVIIPSSARDYVTENGKMYYPSSPLARILAKRCERIGRLHVGPIGTVPTVVRGNDLQATTLAHSGLIGVDMEVACLFRLVRQHTSNFAALLICSDHVFDAPLSNIATRSAKDLPLKARARTMAKLVLELAIDHLIGDEKRDGSSLSYQRTSGG